MDSIIEKIKQKYSREAITKMSQEQLQAEVLNEIDKQNNAKKVRYEEDEGPAEQQPRKSPMKQRATVDVLYGGYSPGRRLNTAKTSTMPKSSPKKT
jgi:hypothetical protein